MATTKAVIYQRHSIRILLGQAALIGAGYLAKRLVLEPEFRRRMLAAAQRALDVVRRGLGKLAPDGVQGSAAQRSGHAQPSSVQRSTPTVLDWSPGNSTPHGGA